MPGNLQLIKKVSLTADSADTSTAYKLMLQGMTFTSADHKIIQLGLFS